MDSSYGFWVVQWFMEAHGWLMDVSWTPTDILWMFHGWFMYCCSWMVHGRFMNRSWKFHG
jgi:hypothetical protein